MTGQDVDQAPEFDYEIGWAQDYTRLFRGEFAESTGAADLLEKSQVNGRVMLCGKGGCGKTTIVNLVRDLAQESDFEVVFVDMSKWSSKHSEMLDRLDKSATAYANYLLANLAEPTTNLSSIDQMAPTQKKLVIIDGLNEVPSGIGNLLLIAADRLAAAFLNLSVIATDRIARRSLDEERWALGIVRPLRGDYVEQLVDGNLGTGVWKTESRRHQQVMELPFFLDKVLRDKQLVFEIGEYLKCHAGLSDATLADAARGAFTTCQAGYGGRTFPMNTFSDSAGVEVTELLQQAGTLLTAEEQFRFSHHLTHDYLAALHLANQPDDWSRENFDALSFRASSFDAISLVLEQLESEHGDSFIRQVYDWNPYAAAYSISESTHAERRLTVEMELVITAMLAEKRWDVVRPTVIRAEDALATLDTDHSRGFLEADTLQRVIEIVSNIESTVEWFIEWQRLFTRPPDSRTDDQEIVLLESKNSILGWTSANVLRRLKLSDSQFRYVRNLAESNNSPTIRWRAVHVLGKFGSKENSRTLFRRLKTDSDIWVQYGALRSLMEMAAKSEKLRSGILEELAGEAGLLARSDPLKSEFSRAADANVDKTHVAEWISGLGGVLRALSDRAENEHELKQWSNLSRELGERYAA